MPRIAPPDLVHLSEAMLRAIGARTADARVVAEHLVSANLAGHDSHGVIRLPQYRRDVESGKIRTDASPEVLRETSTTALLDGRSAWGQVVAGRAVDLAIDKAR